MERILLCGNERISELRSGSSSKGDQPKWRSGDTWYKADHMGYEGAAEVVVSTLLEKSNVPNFVKYRPVRQSLPPRESTAFCLAVEAWMVDMRDCSMPKVLWIT